MVVHQNNGATRCYDRGPKNFPGMNPATVQRPERNQIVSDDSAPGVEDEHDKRFFTGIKPLSLRDVVPPVSGNDFRVVCQLIHGLAFTDLQDFEFMGGVGFEWHKKKKAGHTNASGLVVGWGLFLDRDVIPFNEALDLSQGQFPAQYLIFDGSRNVSPF